jgi:catechol 2,3-dioxygenase-like lactoylglutathione lyase family enzyme
LIRTHGFLHITISVRDLARATAFYRDVLGCEIVHENPIMTFMKTGSDMFVLTQLDNHVRPNPPGPIGLHTTLFHHALLIEPDEFDAAIAQLHERGIETYDCSDAGHRTFPGRRHVYVFDPDGNSIELATMTDTERAGAL